MLKIESPLVDVHWLKKNFGDPNLIILDASIKKVTKADAKEPSKKGIPNSRFFDIENDFSDNTAEFPNTLPSLEQFQYNARKLGIDNETAIVVYDDKGIYSSPRAWYLFKIFGHDNVAVLDGGLSAWIEDGNQLKERLPNKYKVGNFKADFRPNLVKFFDDIQKIRNDRSSLIIDARSKGRFNGTEPEPRVGLRGGNIPGSKSLPYSDLFNGYYFKTPQELKRIFDSYKTEEKPLTFSCGSGITACVLALGAELSELENFSIYDGSWTEWASLVE